MAQREQVFVGQPPIFGGSRLLPSPSQFYLTGEDRLRVVSVNSLAGVSLKVQWRTAITSGEIVPSSVDHTPNSDRTVKAQDYELGTGSLLNVTVFASAGSPLIGQSYVMVQIIRGDSPAAIVLGTILAGYITATQALGFPGSSIVSSTEGEPYARVIQGATPAAGALITEAVPTGARWELTNWNFRLQASALAANRVPYFQAMAGALVIATTVHSTAVVAGELWDFTCGPNLAYLHSTTAGRAQLPLPQRLVVPSGATFSTGASNLQANDQLSNVAYVVREWLEVP